MARRVVERYLELGLCAGSSCRRLGRCLLRARRSCSERVDEQPVRPRRGGVADARRGDRRARRWRGRGRARRRPAELAAGPARRARNDGREAGAARRSPTSTRSSGATACGRRSSTSPSSRRRTDDSTRSCPAVVRSPSVTSRGVSPRPCRSTSSTPHFIRWLRTFASARNDCSGCPTVRHRMGARDRQAVVGVQLLPRRPSQPCRDQHRPAGAEPVTRPPRRARGLSRPSHRAHPQGSRPRPAPRTSRGDDLPRRHAAMPAGGGAGRPGHRGAARSRSRTAARAEHLRPLGIPYDAEVVAAVRPAGETLGAVRGNAAWLLHQDGRPADEVVGYLERWSLLPRARAEKAVEFLTDPTWRAYISCYIEGLRLCRGFVAGRPRPVRATAHRAAGPERFGAPPDPAISRGRAVAERS